MTFRPPKPETRERHRIERAAAMARNREDTARRVLAAYLTDPDRENAEIMWGDDLRRYGNHPDSE